MMFLIQCIDCAGRTIDDDVTGFPMTSDGAETVRQFLQGRIHATSAVRRGFTYIVVPVEGGEE